MIPSFLTMQSLIPSPNVNARKTFPSLSENIAFFSGPLRSEYTHLAPRRRKEPSGTGRIKWKFILCAPRWNVSTCSTTPLFQEGVTTKALYTAFAAVFTNIPLMRAGIPEENRKYTFSSYPIFMLTKSSPAIPYFLNNSLRLWRFFSSFFICFPPVHRYYLQDGNASRIANRYCVCSRHTVIGGRAVRIEKSKMPKTLDNIGFRYCFWHPREDSNLRPAA